jgi:hypothetical protein
MEWESYRLDVAGRDIMVTADDSNVFRDRDGKINGNTGDTDASGLNVVDATDSVIQGSESADEAPWQTRAAMRVDLAGAESDSEEPEEDEAEDAEAPPSDDAPSQASPSTGPTQPTTTTRPRPARAAAVATAVVAPAPAPGDDDEDADEADPGDTGDEGDEGDEGADFPYHEWVASVRRNRATAINTDDGTTLASGADALVIGSDGYDDDDVRAAGSNIIITRDDGNVVLGGTGKVNAQIGDSEQGAVIMDVRRTRIKGGGAY